MTDLREAAQMALDALEWCYDVTEWPANGNSPQDKAIEALRAALAQPEQEPVAWDPKIERLYDKNGFLLHQKIKRTPSSEWEDYYPEPQRKWQGLTDEDYEAMAEKYVTNYYFDTLKYARAIEARLKGKNA